jgi:gluconate 5-dehydrogenase
MPGPIEDTNLFKYLTGSTPGMKDHMQEMIPLHRVGRPEDIAEAVIYFCSDAASFVTGQVMAIDGGMTLG